ncbi:hypothetical protein EW15_1630 [Prochlorococcus sp. MIT 0801]|nr:hypothetical protein EW15_1630 [Prochlorococcus sp. MIT 0801]
MSGKSLTEHITDLVSKSLSDNDILNTDLSSVDKIKALEERILSLESIVSNREYLSQKLKPFTNLEAVNCTKFMRGVFDKELEKRNYEDKSKAFDDLLQSVQVYERLSKSFSDRFKEIMLDGKATPWTGGELNELTGENKCNCPIRKGLIHWTGKIECPSQQEICDRGEELLPLL